MKSFADRVVRLLAPVLICGITIAVSTAANAQEEAITATVIGENIQKVGYRAMIQKQAIKYNLAGYARNNPDGTVGVGLQGDQSRIAKTLEAISAGNKKSSKANIIGEAAARWIRISGHSLSLAGHRPAETSLTLTIWFLTFDRPITSYREKRPKRFGIKSRRARSRAKTSPSS
jgi:acylphosphatase